MTFLGGTFECKPCGMESGTEVNVCVNYHKIELMDYTDEGAAAGTVSFILYKGNYYHLTVTADNGDELQVHTDEQWDDGDIVGIRIQPEDIVITSKAEER